MNEWFLIALILASMSFGGSIVFSFMSLKLAAVHWQHSEEPTQDEVDAIANRLSATGYSSEAVEVYEDWTREKWGMESTFTTQWRAETAVPCDECGHPESTHRWMSQAIGNEPLQTWRWCTECDVHPQRPVISLAAHER